ncbi:MAG: phosphatidylglycerophosphatase A [Acidobacteria bacterium]|nr:phosphatidylglycerophosphatase A [Acidobacteriota bacterium]
MNLPSGNPLQQELTKKIPLREPLTPSLSNPTKPAVTRGIRRRWAVVLATGLGAGYLPIMPGTYGSALGVALYLGLAAFARTTPHPFATLLAASLILVGATIGVVALALPSFSSKDPQTIVLDEVAGQLLTLLALPVGLASWTAVVVGFLLFRALDTMKPYPIWKMGHWRGAWGVVADDLGAGVVGAALLAGSSYWLSWP